MPTNERGAFEKAAHERLVDRPKLIPLARVHLTYLWRHHRMCSIGRPSSFNHFVQRRKLIDRDPRIPLLIDKVKVKRAVASVLGTDWITPTLWSGHTLPDTRPVATPFMVKSRHGCNQSRINALRAHAYAGERAVRHLCANPQRFGGGSKP